MIMRWIHFVAAACVLALLLIIKPNITGNIAFEQQSVARVIDGDTIKLSSGEKVRLLNIDTPERGQHYWRESTARMKALAENMSVFLEADKTNRDRYGRLLRYVYCNESMLNIVMVREGYGCAYYIPPDDRHYKEIIEAEAYAKAHKLGIWQFENITDAFCVWVYEMKPDPKGRDEENLNGEYVVFRNSCTRAVNMTGWKVSGERGSFTFPDFILQSKKTVSLHTGSGANNVTDVYWGSSKPVWKNEHDTLLAYNAQGQMVLNYSY